MQPADFGGREVEHRQTLLALGGVAARAQRADIERGRLQCLEQHHVVELGVVRDGDHRAVRVELQLEHQVVRHGLAEARAGNVPAQVVFLARVAADHFEIERKRHLRDGTRELPGADDEQAPAWPEQRAQQLAVKAENLAARGRFHNHSTRFQFKPARHQFVARRALQHLGDPRRIAQRLLHQAQIAAARQAEARRLFLADAVGDQRGFADPFAMTNTLDQVVFDAAARDRTRHLAVVAHRQQRAGRARCRAPGFDHCHQPNAVARCAPVARLSQHLKIKTVHEKLLSVSGLRGFCVLSG